MKKLFAVFCLCAVVFSGCSSKKESETFITATDLLPAEEAAAYIGFEPVVTETDTKLRRSAKYKNSVVGEGDIAELILYPPNERKSAEDLKKDFDAAKQKCEEFGTLIQIDETTTDMFISIPSIHLYKNGCYSIITAGSGGGDEQIALLKNLAAIVSGHIEEQFTPEEEKQE